MISDNLKGILGLCRKAGKISPGHDAAVTSIKGRKAKLVITCCDASQRLKKEIKDECEFDNRNIPYIDASFSMAELALCLGTRAGVIAVDDPGFAKKLISIITGGYVND